jgi:hypothetical protein
MTPSGALPQAAAPFAGSYFGAMGAAGGAPAAAPAAPGGLSTTAAAAVAAGASSLLASFGLGLGGAAAPMMGAQQAS